MKKMILSEKKHRDNDGVVKTAATRFFYTIGKKG